MNSRKAQVTKMLVGILLGLAVVAAGWFLINHYAFENPSEAIEQLTSCKSLVNVAGQGQCFADENCEGAPGWTFLLKAQCSPPREYCCLLPDKNYDEYYTPGTLILSYDGNNFRLDPDTEKQIKVKKEKVFTIYYHPHIADDVAADATCTLALSGGGVINDFNECFKRERDAHGWITFWSGTGQEFFEARGDPKGKRQPPDGYSFTLSTTAQGNAVDSVDSSSTSSTYTNVLKILP